MIQLSLKAFKIKPKPDPYSKLFQRASTLHSSAGLFPRSKRLFSARREDFDPLALEAEVLRITREFLKDVKHSRPYRLNNKASFASLGLDSLDSIDLVIELEERLGVDLSNYDAENRIKTIQDAVQVFSEYALNAPARASQFAGRPESSFSARL